MSKARDLANAGTALTTVSATELGYLDGVTSAVQTQINSKIAQATAINPTIVDAKGDIIAASAADTVARLAVGANDTVLTADSSTGTGLKWATAAGPNYTTTAIASGTFSSATTLNITGITAKQWIILVLSTTDGSASGTSLTLNSDGTSKYYSNMAGFISNGSTSNGAGMNSTSSLFYGPRIWSTYGTYSLRIDGTSSTGPKAIDANFIGTTGASKASGFYTGTSDITSINMTFDAAQTGTYRVIGI